MCKLTRATVGTLIGTVVATVMGFVEIPAIVMWYRSIGENHPFSYYLPICALAGVHGAKPRFALCVQNNAIVKN